MRDGRTNLELRFFLFLKFFWCVREREREKEKDNNNNNNNNKKIKKNKKKNKKTEERCKIYCEAFAPSARLVVVTSYYII